MNDTRRTKSPEYDKIALLGLFILSLFFANLIVTLKSRISFSDPIILPESGLSASMPSGRNWQSQKKWNYEDNMFSVSCLFPRGSERPTAWASCRYLLSAEKTTPQLRFEQRASAINAVITETNRTQTSKLTFNWARIEIPELNFSMFFGTSRLPDNRQLDIEVSQISGESQLAERIFGRIIEDLQFEDNRLLNAGAEIVAAIKSKGLDSFLNNQNHQAYFLIKDDKERNIGFTMDVIVNSGVNGSATIDQPDIRAASQFYIRGQNNVEHATSFQCSNNLDEFDYKSETSSINGRIRAEISLDAADVLTIRKSQLELDEQNYHLGPAMIPDIFLVQLLTQMLENEKEQIVIDIIEATGKIIPTLLTAIDTKRDVPDEKDAAYAFELKLLDGRGFSETLFLNHQKQVYKRLARQDFLFILERTDAENIAREFPEHAERILRNYRMLK